MSKYRYLLFSFHTYYPSGGVDDFLFGFNTVDDIDFSEEFFSDKVNILDVLTMEKFEFDVYGNTPDLSSFNNDYDKRDEFKNEIVRKWITENFK